MVMSIAPAQISIEGDKATKATAAKKLAKARLYVKNAG
jgi:hypothetical protein